MIVTQKKPPEEILSMLEGAKKIALVGCGQCAAACQTGGEKELEEMKTFLEENGKEVVGTILPDECCHKMLVKRDLKPLRDSGAEAILGLACGAGVKPSTSRSLSTPPPTPCSWDRSSGSASFMNTAACAATASWAAPGASAPSPSAPRVWSTAPAAARKTASARSTRKTTAPGSSSIAA